MAQHETLGLLLVRRGLITRPQLYDALRLQRQHGSLLGSCLIQLGYIEQDELLELLSQRMGVPPLLRDTLLPLDTQAASKLPLPVAEAFRIAPVSWDGETLVVAVTDDRAHQASDRLEFQLGCQLKTVVGLERVVDEAILAMGHAESEEQTPGRPAQILHLDTGEPLPVEAPKAEMLVTSVDRQPFYDAIEGFYEAQNAETLCQSMVGALLNYFDRTVVLQGTGDNTTYTPVAQGGVSSTLPALPGRAALTSVVVSHPVYGSVLRSEVAREVCDELGLSVPGTVFLAGIYVEGGLQLLVYADNPPEAPMYEELHDVEMMLKEAETALAMLG